ncbi:MAG: hypothetical protein K6E91_09210 [Butyrivibrio sp.]|nr:hypothetical protein [Butyrivibrio sp.]
MTITQITEDNILQYTEIIPAELVTDLDREYFRALAGAEDKDDPEAVIIWELKDLEDETSPTKAVIHFLDAPDDQIARMMISAFEQKIADDGVGLVTFEIKEMKEDLQSAFEEEGYVLTEENSNNITVTVSELSELRLGDRKIPDYIRSLSDINPRQFKAAVMTSVFHGRYGILDDLPFLPMTRFDQDVSSCVITDDKISGLLLVRKTMDSQYVVELFFAIQPDANKNLLNMMRFSIRSAVKYCYEEDTVILKKHNKESSLLIEKLFPDKEGPMVIKGEKEM